jgi:hypothetical protein
VPDLRGATNCCNDEATPDIDEGLVDGWTLITPAALDRIKGPGTVNWTHLRLGPFSEIVDASLSAFSGRDAQRARLLQASVRRYGAGLEILDDARVAGLAAQERGIYIEWDVVDHWALATQGMNFFGDDCSVTHAALPQRYLDWINAVVEATWDLPGTYNLGNEGFRCRPWPEWERGLYDALKAALAAKGVSRPIGSTVTISDTRTAFDYRTYHGWQVPPASWSRDIPAMLTETDNRSHDAAAWAALARATEAAGHYVSIWRGPESWDSQNGAINAMPKLGEAWPPSPDPTPPPPPSTFPVRFPLEGAVIYMRNARYNAGVDSTPRMQGDPELCELLHGVRVNDCHFDSTVWADDHALRGEYEAKVLAGARHGGPEVVGLCPIWMYRSGSETGRCHDDRDGPIVSCDHFGNTVDRDDPQTPDVFEGKPAVCGLQRDEFGPYAGFFMVPQCTAGRECSVRACGPLGQECGPWVAVTWRK